MKRQRGRGGNNNGRKPGGHSPNRSFDSNGPEVKVRGPAPHIYERYLQLARDATSAGDRVMAENFLQHAEHYFRVMRAMTPAMPTPQLQDRYDDADFDGDDEGAGEEGALAAEGGEGQRGDYQQQPRDQREFQPRENRGDYQQRQPRGEYQQQPRDQRGPREQREQRGDFQPREQREFQPREQRNDQPRDQQREPREPREQREGEVAANGAEGDDGFRRNNRRRRNRFRADGEDRGPRPEGEGAPREERQGPQDGFGDSVPAFLGND